jgi:hypothetical protein
MLRRFSRFLLFAGSTVFLSIGTKIRKHCREMVHTDSLRYNELSFQSKRSSHIGKIQGLKSKVKIQQSNVKSHISSQNKSENLKVKIKTKHLKVETSAGRNLGQLSCEQHKIIQSLSTKVLFYTSPILDLCRRNSRALQNGVSSEHVLHYCRCVPSQPVGTTRANTIDTARHVGGFLFYLLPALVLLLYTGA